MAAAPPAGTGPARTLAAAGTTNGKRGLLSREALASGWAAAEESSWLIQLPHFQFKEIMKRRKRQEERLGPGTYNIRDFLQETRPCSLRGICDTREQRFRDAHRNCFPGPGTYSPQGNPYSSLERARRSAGRRGLMDSGTPRCALPAATGSSLGPGTYDPWSSTERGLRRAGGPGHGPGQSFSRDRSKAAHGGRQTLERGTELSTGTVKSFVDKLTSKENEKKGRFSTLPRNTGCPTERIFWATLSQCPRKVYAVGPGSYNPKPFESSASCSQAPFWSSAKRFDRRSFHLFTGNQNPVGVGRYDISKQEKCPQKLRSPSLYQRDAQRYLSNLQRDACLLERLKPVAKSKWGNFCHVVQQPLKQSPFAEQEMVLGSPER
ncbi:ciliary microtubule-associated protein 2 [Colius striatus]|uniref:ciliary microtubule-associated protein 2 n=1 Tax=Colius striatus TaxID=57412 RepID=UPI002B1D551B|nr:ciliary microtubule-associated protein 2 [Colius striatus]